MYGAHTAIDNFIIDIDPVFKVLNSGGKKQFNVSRGLRVDSHRPTHDFLELFYSYSLMPTIYKSANITESIAIIIDNINTSQK